MVSQFASATLMLFISALAKASDHLEVSATTHIGSLDLHNHGNDEHFHGKRSTDYIGVKQNERRFLEPYRFCLKPNDELCCGKNVFRGQFDYNVLCCADEFYDSETARCCNDKILLAANDNLQCCGDGLYDQAKQLCCNSGAYAMEVNQQCCDTAAYNVLNQICCNLTLTDIDGKVMSCCGDKAYEPTMSHCINNEVRDCPTPEDVTQICGTELINFNTQICCDDKPLDRGTEAKTMCCGDATFSASTQLCCNGTVISDPPDDATCCVNNTFDQFKQVCCSNGKILDLPVFVDGTGCFDHYECCGDQLINTDDQTQLCCDDQLYEYETNEERTSYSCCASKAYKRTDQICCQDKLFPMTNQLDGRNHYYCCAAKAYYTADQICCLDTLFSITDHPNDSYDCCNSTVYDTVNQVCCGDTVLPGSPFLRCCANQTYDFNTQMCCGDTLYEHREVPADKCCGFSN